MDRKAQVKQWIKGILAAGQQRQYHKLLEKKTITYDAWIKRTEALRDKDRGKGTGEGSMSVKQIPYESCRDYVLNAVIDREEAEILLFVSSEGKAAAEAESLVAEFFAAHKDAVMLYGDEDVQSPDGSRYTPWLKPDWSPDTFLSFFYFGSIFAVRKNALSGLTEEERQWIWKKKEKAEKEEIYRMCYVLALKNGGFARRKASEKEPFSFPVGHVDEILFHGSRNRELEFEEEESLSGAGCPVCVLEQQDKKEKENRRLSVVIPSKDHEDTLKRCIRSMERAMTGEKDKGIGYEVIVVDNGSEAEVRQRLEVWLREQGILYLYREMPFHFSQMCNMGAKAATGEVLLFLNDDVEIPEAVIKQGRFGSALYEMAVRDYIGAVGTKLYYPGSVRIQHAGIVNLRLGPVHKLQFQEDKGSYYYGYNKRMRNVIAVTGACLAVKKSRFEAVGGFPEELPVAFNDVDLCFSLFEKGYYNVVLQDMALYHHESLSRGNDDDREKLSRLLGERDKLYDRHPDLYGKDPFYHKYFAGDMLSTGFELKADYEWENGKYQRRAKHAGELLAGAREDACVIVSLEYAGTVKDFCREGESRAAGLWVQGYAFVAGSDNACYEKLVILEREGSQREGNGTSDIWYVKPEIKIRRDVEENLPDQVNVGLTGFTALIEPESLPVGAYRIGVLVKDKCSGQKLYSRTNRYLNVE